MPTAEAWILRDAQNDGNGTWYGFVVLNGVKAPSEATSSSTVSIVISSSNAWILSLRSE